MIEDLSKRRPDITFTQLIGLCPKLKKEWRCAVNPRKKNVQKMAGRVMSITEPLDICPSVEAWHKGLGLGELMEEPKCVS